MLVESVSHCSASCEHPPCSCHNTVSTIPPCTALSVQLAPQAFRRHTRLLRCTCVFEQKFALFLSVASKEQKPAGSVANQLLSDFKPLPLSSLTLSVNCLYSSPGLSSSHVWFRAGEQQQRKEWKSNLYCVFILCVSGSVGSVVLTLILFLHRPFAQSARPACASTLPLRVR